MWATRPTDSALSSLSDRVGVLAGLLVATDSACLAERLEFSFSLTRPIRDFQSATLYHWRMGHSQRRMRSMDPDWRCEGTPDRRRAGRSCRRLLRRAAVQAVAVVQRCPAGGAARARPAVPDRHRGPAGAHHEDGAPMQAARSAADRRPSSVRVRAGRPIVTGVHLGLDALTLGFIIAIASSS